MWSAVTAAASLVIGYEICARIWRPASEGDALRGAERATFISIAGLSVWLASTWALALTHSLSQAWLIGRTCLFVVVALAILIFRVRIAPGLFERQVETRVLVWSILPFVPLGLWMVYILWRSGIVPPLTHDALSYHLVRALMFVRAGGYTTLESLRYLITPRPANYELLLAEGIAMDGVDDYTEWLSLFAFAGFVIAAAALAQRWSRGNPDVTVAVALLSAASPLVLLHSGAHKNDLFTAYCLIAALVAVGRWLSEGDVRALILSAAGFAIAIGTKTPAFLVPLFLAPFVVWKVIRDRMPWRRVAAIALAGALLFGALGGWTVVSVKETVAPATPVAAIAAPAERQYGDWSNLWRGTWVLLSAPYSRSPHLLRVPWSDDGWFWRRYEIYFSELGAFFPICAVLLPIALFRKRSFECVAIAVAVLATVAVLLPVHRLPAGVHLIGLPRLVMYLAPVVFAAVIAAWSRFAKYAIAAGVLIFSVYGMSCLLFDEFVPFSYVLWAREHPGTRIVPFSPTRAAVVLDRLAGPRDVVAMDAGPLAWTYPAFGAKLTRKVELIPPGDGPPVIAPDAQWLVIDHGWNRVWGDPAFNDLGQWRHRLNKGQPTAADIRVLRYAMSSPEWEAMIIRPLAVQAVFRRKR